MEHFPCSDDGVQETQRLAAEQRARLARFVEERYASQPLLCAFVSGSLVEGMGDHLSDYDIYVVLPEVASGDSERHAEYFFRRFDATLEVTEVPIASVERIVRRLADTTERDEPGQNDLHLAYRILTGEPLLHADAFARVQASVTASQASHWLTLLAMRSSYSAMFDVLGSAARDPQAAVYNAMRLVGYCADFATSAQGGLSVLYRWRMHRLRSVAARGQAWAEGLARLLMPRADAAAYVTRTLDVFQSTCDAWFLLQTGAAGEAFAPLRALFAQDAPAGLRTGNAFLVSWAKDARFALCIEGERWLGVDPVSARVWALLGCGLQERQALLARLRPLEVTPRRLEQVLQQFAGAGLLRAPIAG